MHDGINLKLLQQRPYGGLVTNIAAHKTIARILIEAGEIFDIPGVGERIEHDHATFVSVRQPMAHEVGTDKVGSARNKHITRHEVHPASSLNCAANGAQAF